MMSGCLATTFNLFTLLLVPVLEFELAVLNSEVFRGRRSMHWIYLLTDLSVLSVSCVSCQFVLVRL